MIKHFVFVHTFTSSLHGLNRLSITFFEVGCDAYCCPSAIFRPASYGRVENRCAQLVISVLAPYFMLFSSVNENHEARIAYVTVIVYWKVQCIFFCVCVCARSHFTEKDLHLYFMTSCSHGPSCFVHCLLGARWCDGKHLLVFAVAVCTL